MAKRIEQGGTEIADTGCKRSGGISPTELGYVSQKLAQARTCAGMKVPLSLLITLSTSFLPSAGSKRALLGSWTFRANSAGSGEP